MSAISLAAPAKLNLSLLVGPPRADGYHPVRTLLVALDGLADTVQVAVAARRRVACPGVPERENLAWRAMDALEAAGGREVSLDVTIHKRIPAQAGLGGGSSDAAAVLRAARRLLALTLDDDALERVAADVGSDVPFFVRGGVRWAGGRGEDLAPAAAPAPPPWVLLTRPHAALPTGAVYAAADRRGAWTPLDGDWPPHPLTDWRRDARVRNDLWPAALALAPALGRVARGLRAAGAERVLLCGSGGAMAGLFAREHDARAAARALGARALAVTRPAPPVPPEPPPVR